MSCTVHLYPLWLASQLVTLLRNCLFALVTDTPSTHICGSHCPALTAPFRVGARSCLSPTLPAATSLAPPSARSPSAPHAPAAC
eukprot:1657147-Pyramimonas_sp.AAC.1